jgi:hypothetical protein
MGLCRHADTEFRVIGRHEESGELWESQVLSSRAPRGKIVRFLVAAASRIFRWKEESRRRVRGERPLFLEVIYMAIFLARLPRRSSAERAGGRRHRKRGREREGKREKWKACEHERAGGRNGKIEEETDGDM